MAAIQVEWVGVSTPICTPACLTLLNRLVPEKFQDIMA
jgi:hypothetical protein